MPIITLFILPSTEENYPYSILEAGLLNILCICSNVGGISEIIKDNNTGFLICPNDVEITINIINKILLKNRFKNITDNLYNQVINYNNISKIAYKYKEIFK